MNLGECPDGLETSFFFISSLIPAFQSIDTAMGLRVYTYSDPQSFKERIWKRKLMEINDKNLSWTENSKSLGLFKNYTESQKSLIWNKI